MSPILAASSDPLTPVPVRGARRFSPLPGLRVLPGGSAPEPAVPAHRHTRRPTPLMPLLPMAYRGSYLRRLLSPRRPVEQALLSVIEETYLAGAGTRTIDALAETVGAAGKTRSEVDSVARDWDARVDAFRRRPLRDIYPYLMLFETPVLIHATGGAESCQVVVAVGRTASGDREVVGFDIRSEVSTASFWQTFLGELAGRGLRSLQIVTADSIDGLLPALDGAFPAARWQRCREGFLAEAIRLVPPAAKHAVAASLRPVFAQPDSKSALEAIARVRTQFEFSCPELVETLGAPVGSVLTYFQAPPSQRRAVSSMNALTSLQRELRQSCQLVGIFPQRRALVRLCGAVLQEISDEWAARATPRRRRPTAAVVWEAQLASKRAASAWAAA